MNLLITGGAGVMAQALLRRFPDAETPSRSTLDVRKPTGWPKMDHTWTSVHAAAITDHQCPDMKLLLDTNVVGTANAVACCEMTGAKMVYLSTHYVYPGRLGGYTEKAKCQPIGNYALTKYAGERLVESRLKGALIIRGSWYTPAKLALWQHQGVLTDAWCSRTNVERAAQMIAQLITLDATGIYNIGGERRTFEEILRDEHLTPARTISRKDAPSSYPFPADSSVDISKYQRLLAQ